MAYCVILFACISVFCGILYHMRSYYTVSEAALRLGCSEKQVRQDVLAGVIPGFFRKNRRCSIPASYFDGEPANPNVGCSEVLLARMDQRGYVPTYAKERKACGIQPGTVLRKVQVGRFLCYRNHTLGENYTYASVASDLVRDGILELLADMGGYIHPGPPDKVMSFAEIRQAAVENPDLQVCPPSLGFWIPWARLLGAKAFREM
jgi:hypothetical protein